MRFGFLLCLLDVTAINSNEGHLSHGIDSSISSLPFSSCLDIIDVTSSAPFYTTLAWSDLPFSTHIDQVSSTPLSYDLNDDHGSVLEPTIDFTSDPVPLRSTLSVDPTSQYLYALDLHLQDTNSDRSTYYDQSMSFTLGPHLYAHMDAGSMANTTNHIDYLWDFHSLEGSTMTLNVADDTPHHPTGVGHL